jgi:hypothetical protein
MRVKRVKQTQGGESSPAEAGLRLRRTPVRSYDAAVERRYELEILERSIAMLTPNAASGIRREEALELISELGELHRRIEVLRAELRHLADDL